jgi:hypothetical protein
MRPAARALVSAGVWAFVSSAAAQKIEPFEGYLCCNLYSSGSWISDLNYRDRGKTLVPVGTKVKVSGFGRWRILTEIDGKKVGIGNDYSRTVSMETFLSRYVLTIDPQDLLARMPDNVRDAIKAGKVMRGMTREQVAMAVGWPSATSTPSLDAVLWRYWIDSGSEFQVFWDERGLVDRIFGSPEVRKVIAIE